MGNRTSFEYRLCANCRHVGTLSRFRTQKGKILKTLQVLRKHSLPKIVVLYSVVNSVARGFGPEASQCKQWVGDRFRNGLVIGVLSISPLAEMRVVSSNIHFIRRVIGGEELNEISI
ncbi:hypothetical protein CEXT_386391 [Caerostris extrusa]|uniref:Uncharacterized protein n=1 Tax=Caerostris extrusa TaxID=172846 RepID=A0AAV4W685_CAEEX|nr:hypothetical protein CEXT_386391 [Caerostris extrusa]